MGKKGPEGSIEHKGSQPARIVDPFQVEELDDEQLGGVKLKVLWLREVEPVEMEPEPVEETKEAAGSAWQHIGRQEAYKTLWLKETESMMQAHLRVNTCL